MRIAISFAASMVSLAAMTSMAVAIPVDIDFYYKVASGTDQAGADISGQSFAGMLTYDRPAGTADPLTVTPDAGIDAFSLPILGLDLTGSNVFELSVSFDGAGVLSGIDFSYDTGQPGYAFFSDDLSFTYEIFATPTQVETVDPETGEVFIDLVENRLAAGKGSILQGVPSPEMPVVPLPGGAPLLLGALMGFGLLRRAR